MAVGSWRFVRRALAGGRLQAVVYGTANAT